jgi:hypothetical protein
MYESEKLSKITINWTARFNSLQRWRFISSSLCPGGTGGLSPGVKPSDYEADHSHAFIANV